MIINDAETQAVSSLGWVDKGALWVYKIGGGKPSRVALSDANYLAVHPGAHDHFAVVHCYDGDRLKITAHHHNDPQHIVSTIEFAARADLLQLAKGALKDAGASIQSEFSGDTAVWSSLPRAYVAYAFGNYYLILVDRRTKSVEVQTFAWYDNSYDKGYQGIVGVTKVPHSPWVIVSVQRDSSPVLYDPTTRTVIQKLSLAGQFGNPTLSFRRNAREVWASDYDTLVRLDSQSWELLAKLKIQEPKGNVSQFIGHFSFNNDETLCVVGRPYSGDAVGVDAKSFRVTHSAKLGGEPLDVALVSGRHVIARDWHTGQLREGELKEL